MYINNFIGQVNLLSKISKFPLSTLPHSIILTGQCGSGRHTITKYISDKFELDYTLIDNYKDIKDTIQNSYDDPKLKLFVLDSSKLTIQAQNSILKFIEEPLQNMYIIIINDYYSVLLDTIKGRCYELAMDLYSNEDLNNFTNDEYILAIFRTPGKILYANKYDIKSYIDLSNNILDRINKSSIPNVFTICNKISFKQEEQLININYFVEIFMSVAKNKFITSKDARFLNVYLISSKLYNNLQASIDKRRIFEQFLLDIRGILSE